MNAPAAPGALAPLPGLLVPLEQLTPSPTNPRKHFDEAAIAELAESIAKQGVLQPLLVRARPGFEGDGFEIVCGERRWRACRQIGLRELPCLVRTLSDKEVLEIQVVENLQRADLHPLEEAQGYEALRAHGYEVEDIAAKVGKSSSYVYQRLKLAALTEDARKWFLSGKLSASTALLVARIPIPSLQKKAAQAIGDPPHRTEPLGFREASQLVQREFMLQLTAASFPIDDATLVAGAGPCTVCPRRTGNAPDLFQDVSNGDTCTDPGCFKSKREAFVARRLKEAELEGVAVLKGKDAKSVKPHQYGELKGYRALDDVDYRVNGDKPLRKVLGKGAIVSAVMEDPHTPGRVVELISEAALADALKAKGVKVPGVGTDAKEEVRRAAEADASKRDRALREALLAEIRTKHKGDLQQSDLAWIAAEVVHGVDLDLLCVPRGYVDGLGRADYNKLLDAIPSMNTAELGRLMLEASLVEEVRFLDLRNAKRLLSVCERLKIDPKQVRARLSTEQKAETKAKSASTPSSPAARAPKTAAKKRPATPKKKASKK